MSGGEKVAPCPNPWCKAGVGPQVFHLRNGRLAVICGCDFHGPECDTRADAIAAWNTRTPDPLLVPALEALRELDSAWCHNSVGMPCNLHVRLIAILAQAQERGL